MGPFGDDRTQRAVGESKSEEWEIPVGNLDEHVGGVVDFRLFQYPEGPRPAMKWTVRNVFSVDDRLKNIPYPDPTS